MEIRVDDLSGPEIQALLGEHLADMYEASPAESGAALDLDALREPGITFWTVWDGETLLGCGALKQLDEFHGEIKSMRTTSAARRRGVARRVLDHAIGEARSRGYTRVSLETGPQDFFEPARRLYASFGFTPCGPFGSYGEDPYSAFFTYDLRA